MSIQIQDIKKGDVFYETCGRHTACFTATEDAHEIEESKGTKSGWQVHGVEKETGKTVTFFASHESPHYGPRLYRKPAYFTGIGNP